MKAANWRLWLSLAAVLASAALLWPSYQYHYMLSEAQRRSTADVKINALRDKAIHLGLDLQGGIHLLLEVDKSKLGAAEAKDAVERAMEVIRNRVDQFGVAEPLIQKEGDNRIAVQLPGMNDPDRAKDLIGQTALLEFKLVRSDAEMTQALTSIDSWLRAHPQAMEGATSGRDSLAAAHPLSARVLEKGGGYLFFAQEELKGVYPMLQAALKDSLLLPSDWELQWGDDNEGINGRTGRVLYLLNRNAELNGSAISRALAQPNPQDPTSWQVEMGLNPQGRGQFSNVTGRNVGRQLAIVLDNKVKSAPTIQGHIREGNASITGRFTPDQARDLAIVLKAGALPAPVHIIEERSVGPTLGSDSIHKGLLAFMVGAGLVSLFMIVYYQASGVIAVVAMMVNVLILLAFMPLLKQTLTLPGIAGVVLTIGVSVDANVLIFERIREELRSKKTVAAAVTAGYNRAWVTILDAHVTAFLSSLFLFMFGTGPIKGFAVTFSVGLIANLFTAVFMTRYVFDSITAKKRLESLSI